MKKIISFTIFLFLISSIVKSLPSQQNTADESVTIKEVIPFVYCSIHHEGPYTEISNIIGMLMQTSRSQNIFPAGPIFGIFHNAPGEVQSSELEWEIGFPVTVQVSPQLPLRKQQWTYSLVASAFHKGPYEESNQTYTKIFKWMEVNNYVQAGPTMEKYLTAPTPGTKPQDLLTEIWIPCKKNE